MDALRVGLSQSDTVTDAPSIGAAVGRASLVNVTYLTAAGADTAARGTDNQSVFIGVDPQSDASAVGRLVSFGRTLTTYTDGRWIEIRQPFYGGVLGGGKRGAVTSFSAQSRKRFMKKIYILQSSSRCLWVTLTQPAAFVGSIGARRMAKLWTARVRRAYPAASGLWRIQPQKRGAPHFHVMVYGIPADGLEIKTVRARLAAMWTAVVVGGIANGDTLSARSRGQIARYGCDVAELETAEGVQRYVSRYLSRTDAVGNAAVVGRQWGSFNRDALPVSQTETVTVSRQVAQNVVRAARRLQTRSFTRPNGKTVKWTPKYRTTSSASFIGAPSVWSRYVDILSGGGGAIPAAVVVHGLDANGRLTVRDCDAVSASVGVTVAASNVDAVSFASDAV